MHTGNKSDGSRLGGIGVGVMAEIVEILEKQKMETGRATPETVIALAVRKGKEKEGQGVKNEQK